MFYVSGFTHLVYPGAVHSRFEHSLGVYWIAGQSVEKLNSYQVYFLFYFIFYPYKVTVKFFRWKNYMCLWSYRAWSLVLINLIFNQWNLLVYNFSQKLLVILFPLIFLKLFLTLSSLLLGLLHDVGHGPFSHLFEREFLPRVISGSHWYSSHFNSFHLSLHFSL